MHMQGEMKRYSDRMKREQAYGVSITEVKTVDRDANRVTVVKETNGLLIQYCVNCMTRLPNCFAQCLRVYYTTVEKNCRPLYSFLLTAILKLLRDFLGDIVCLMHVSWPSINDVTTDHIFRQVYLFIL